MSDYRTDLSQMLRQVRTSCGLKQSDVAEALRMECSTYAYYEAGKITPDILTLKKLAEIFSIPPESFFYPEKFVHGPQP